jgi:hypothetical protein
MSEFSTALQPPIAAPDWDPPPGKRTYYRHAVDGQLGWLVRRGGREMIRLDRGEAEVLRHMVEGQWVPDKEHRPLNKATVAKICHAADRELCFALGEHGKAQPDWNDLKQEEKREWMLVGPKSPVVRAVIYARIKDALAELTT